MASQSKLEIVISALNMASKELKAVQGDLGELGKESSKTASVFDSLKSNWKQASLALIGVTAAAYSVKKAFDFGQEGAMLARLEASGSSLAASFGADMDTVISSLQRVSHGTVAETELIASANRAMMLGVTADAEQMANLLEVAALRGRAMGLSTSQAFNDIVTGIGRMSPLILDNLGIVTNMTARVEEYAAANGVSAESVDDATKKQILLGQVLEDGNKQLKEHGGLVFDTAAAYEKFGAQSTDAWSRVKKEFGEFIEPAVSGLADYMEGLNNTAEAQEYLGAEFVAGHDAGTGLLNMYRLLTGELITAEEMTQKYLETQRLASFETERAASLADKLFGSNAISPSSFADLGNEAGAAFANTFIGSIDTGITSQAATIRDKIALAMAGGSGNQDMMNLILSNADAIDPAQLDTLLSRIIPQDLASNVMAGLIDPAQAAQTIFEEGIAPSLTGAWELLGGNLANMGMPEQEVAQLLADQFNSSFQIARGLISENMGSDPLSAADFVDASKETAAELAAALGIPFKDALLILKSTLSTDGKLSPADFLAGQDEAAADIAAIVGNSFTSAAGILRSSISANPLLTVEDIMGAVDANGIADPVNLGLGMIDGTLAAENINETLNAELRRALGLVGLIGDGLIGLGGVPVGGGSGGRIAPAGKPNPEGFASGGPIDPSMGMVEVGEQGTEGMYWDPKQKRWVVVPHDRWQKWKNNGGTPMAGMAAGGSLGVNTGPQPEGFQVSPGGGYLSFSEPRPVHMTGPGGLGSHIVGYTNPGRQRVGDGAQAARGVGGAGTDFGGNGGSGGGQQAAQIAAAAASSAAQAAASGVGSTAVTAAQNQSAQAIERASADAARSAAETQKVLKQIHKDMLRRTDLSNEFADALAKAQ